MERCESAALSQKNEKKVKKSRRAVVFLLTMGQNTG
jgi:hypothetical protein